jgi:thiol-disulfide isomerase/thioredoxin
MTHKNDRALNRLSVVASLGLVLMVGATTTYIAWPRVASAVGIKPAAPPPAPPAYIAGQGIDVPAAWYASSPRTLILFARDSCGACQKAQPFLKTLVAGLKDKASVVMAHPAGTDVEDVAYAKGLGLADANIHVVTANLRVKATPTLVLVDQQGRILAAWEGAGKEEKQAEISKTIQTLIK